MRAGRVEQYIHSDSITENKGGVLFLVTCKSDAAANTEEFKAFCRSIGPLVYATTKIPADAFEGDTPPSFLKRICTAFPETEEVLKDVQSVLKEIVDIAEVHWITL